MKMKVSKKEYNTVHVLAGHVRGMVPAAFSIRTLRTYDTGRKLRTGQKRPCGSTVSFSRSHAFSFFALSVPSVQLVTLSACHDVSIAFTLTSYSVLLLSYSMDVLRYCLCSNFPLTY